MSSKTSRSQETGLRLSFAPTFLAQKRALLAASSLEPPAMPGAVIHALESAPKRSTRLRSPTAILGALCSTFWPQMTLILFLGLVSEACLFAVPIVTVRMFSNEFSIQSASFLLATFVALRLGVSLLRWARTRVKGTLMAGAQVFLCRHIAAKVCALGPLGRSRLDGGHARSLFQGDVGTVVSFLDDTSWGLVPSMIALLLAVPLLWHTAGIPGLAGAAAVLAQLPLSAFLSMLAEKVAVRKRAADDRVSLTLTEWISQRRLVRSLGLDLRFRNITHIRVRTMLRHEVLAHALYCAAYGISFSWWMFPILAVLLVSSLSHSPMALSALFSSLWVLSSLMEKLRLLPNMIFSLGQVKVALARLASFWSLPEAEAELPPATVGEMETYHGFLPVALELSHVSFSYGPSAPVLKDICVTLPFAEKVFLVGEVAAGKSTFLKICTGELQPSSGSLFLIDAAGKRLAVQSSEARNVLRAVLAWVPQLPFVAHATVAENVTLDRQEETSWLLAALQQAQLAQDLEAFPEGSHTLCADKGTNLSGGQRARINVARALFSPRPWLLLDDPLSALDIPTESALADSLFSESRGFLMATHRLAHAGRCHRVLVLSCGAIVENATPQSLEADSESLFAALRKAVSQRGPQL